MSPFDQNYKSQIPDTSVKDRADRIIGEKTRALREKRMNSDDPSERYHASGYIPGMGKRDYTVGEKIRRGSSKVGAGK